MEESFDIIANLPALIFAVFFFASFILFLWGGVILLIAKRRPEKLEEGRRILKRAIVLFFVILTITLVFYLVTFLLQRWYLSRAQTGEGEFPASPSANFPPAPDFVEIGGNYFLGPYPLKEVENIGGRSIFAVLCPKGDNYDIIYLGSGTNVSLNEFPSRKCWFQNCESDLSLAVLLTPKDSYSLREINSIASYLIENADSPCLLQN